MNNLEEKVLKNVNDEKGVISALQKEYKRSVVINCATLSLEKLIGYILKLDRDIVLIFDGYNRLSSECKAAVDTVALYFVAVYVISKTK